MGRANVVLEVGFGDEILPACVVGVEWGEVADVADIERPADVALAIMSCADVHCEVGFLSEGLGAPEIGAGDVLALREGGA